MDLIDLRYQKLGKALTTLDTAVANYGYIRSLDKSQQLLGLDFDEMGRTYRDSMIQRFEYCTELFWKYVKKYLEEYVQAPDINGPAPVIRAAYTAGLLADKEAEQALAMIKDRNLTSHIYKEEIAQQLASMIPHHCVLMKNIAKRLTPQ